jgi:hypothetical protein
MRCDKIIVKILDSDRLKFYISFVFNFGLEGGLARGCCPRSKIDRREGGTGEAPERARKSLKEKEGV